tara:strand:+ start:12626 stop:13783 length:1158 start_codon:yes stop_codon:yes gene_type:complete
MIKISIKFFIFVLLIFHFLIADERSEVKLYIFEDIAYIALEEFFISQDFQYNLYKDKSKIDVIIENKRFTFSTNSSFVKIDDKIYHMIKNIKFFDNNFYAPLNSFMRLYTQFDNKEFIVNYNDKVIIIKETNTVSQQIQEVDQEFLNKIKNENNWKITTIVIDPGHGGKDPGAIGYHNIKEKHIVLDIAKELGSFLKKEMPNLKVIYTRDDDTFLGLKNRTAFANKNEGHMFLSIHANASTAKTARGFEIFLLQANSVDKAIDVAVRENASIFFEDNPEEYEQNQMIASVSENMYLQESEKLAVSIQAAVKKELPKTRMRGIKQAGFYVLVGAAMPKVLIEAGFITNKSEAKLLNKSSYRSEMAYGIFKGVQAYINSHNSKVIQN